MFSPSSLQKSHTATREKKRGEKLYKNDVERNREKLIEQEAVNSNRPRCYFDLRSNSQFTKKRERRTAMGRGERGKRRGEGRRGGIGNEELGGARGVDGRWRSESN